MTTSELTIHFSGFWETFYSESADVVTKNRILEVLFPFLAPENEVSLRRADLVICSVFSDLKRLQKIKSRRGRTIRIIQLTCEARITDPEHNFIDLTIGSDKEGSKDVICPLSLIYYRINRSQLSSPVSRPFDQRKFAVMVGRRTGMRKAIYDALSAYKPIDGYGEMFDNRAPGKYWDQEYINLLSEYRFVICFENEFRRGYHTEKIINPLIAGCIPVYWGSPFIEKIISPERMLSLQDRDQIRSLVQEIRQVDQDGQRFEQILSENPWARGSWQATEKKFGCKRAVDRIKAFLEV